MAEPHVIRMQLEHEELAGKIEKLKTFLSGEFFKRLDSEDQLLLSLQLQAMKTYELVLDARLRKTQS